MWKLISVLLLAATIVASAMDSKDHGYHQQQQLFRKEQNLLQLISKTATDYDKTGNYAVIDKPRITSGEEFDIEPYIEAVAKDSYYMKKIDQLKIDSDGRNSLKCFVDAEKVKFLLFTGENNYVTLNFTKMPWEFKPNVDTKMYIPGKLENPINSGSKLAKEYFKNKHRQLNLIVIDWSEYVHCMEMIMLTDTLPDVGRLALVMIKYLVDNGVLSTKQLHFISQHEGVHVAAEIIRNTQLPFARLTALDPLFTVMEKISNVLPDGEKAVQFVDIIYLNLDAYPSNIQVPYALFFPNGGYTAGYTVRNDQGLEYYAKSINEPRAYPFKKCHRYLAYVLKWCDNNPTNYLGEYVQQNVTGTFFASTPLEKSVRTELENNELIKEIKAQIRKTY